MSEINWNVFGVKYDNKETWAFEQMSYLLFCREFDSRIGLFRYKNQAGIETEPIEKEGKFYGFQAKYYTTSISSNKQDIIDSIKKAKSQNSELNEIYLYINQELSESTSKGKKKPQYQLDIEKYAKAEGVNIQWRVPSHFELQLSLPENKYIYDIFFNLEPHEADLLDEVYKHNENILKDIKTEIFFGNEKIKIDRSAVVESIENLSQKGGDIVISGEGGCGKTSTFKEFYNSNFRKIPICVFKANELNVSHVNDIFQFEHKFTFAQFISTFKDEHIKIFVIDSAEKLAEITNNHVLTTLIKTLKENGWNIIFTTRYAYLNDLTFHIKENYNLSFDVNDISLISFDELKSISEEYKLSLPDNQKFLERLRNLFYLSEYVKQYSNIDKQGSFKGFIDLLWKKRIQNNIVQKNNLHLEREKCIINIAKKRCETGRFYINADNLSQSALFELKQDEILGYDEACNGYFITHDIYEEWTLDKIVSRNFSNHLNTKHFFDELGDSLPIRRAVRLWLSNHLSENSTEIESFIKEAFANNQITRFWKDEILVSVLLSDYSEVFFKFFENEIIANDFKILKRILFLLRIACTDISVYESVKPKGKGWEEVIALIYKHKSAFFDDNLKIVLPRLSDWCNFTKKGTTTRYSGLLALSIIQKTETEENFYINDAEEENILTVVFNSANEIQPELKEIFDKVIANKWINHNDPYKGLCSKILVKPYIATELIKTLPLYVLQLCDLFWQKQPKKPGRFRYNRDDIGMESRYGLAKNYSFNYSPSSANQTPIIWLLQAAFYETLNFIIDFTNRAVESYSKSDYGKNNVVKVALIINEKEVTQYLSNTIWSMYRGGSTSVPYLLQSIHMALEKILLESAQISESAIVKNILLIILIKSKSASLTSIVCSVVLANPNKFHDVALILFKTIELFHPDTIRSANEFQLKSIYSIGYGFDKLKDILYRDERLKTCEDKHRNLNLESLFLNYQLFGITGFTEEQNSAFIEKLYKITDEHKSNPSTSKEFGILLARMDRRNLNFEISKQDEKSSLIKFSPVELSDEDRSKSEQAQIQLEKRFKYFSLRIWANFLFGGRSQNKNDKSEEYNNNPLLALSETKQLVEELQAGRNEMGIMDYSIPASACSKLMIEHKDKLSKEDKKFCREIISSTLSNLFADDYNYQIDDGVEASVRAIPALINEYPKEVEDYIFIMVLTLLNKRPLGQYKRICDYVVETVHKSSLWEQNPEVAQSVLFGYIKLQPMYKNIIATKRKEQDYWEEISKSSIFGELNKLNIDFTLKDIPFEIKDIDSLDVHDLEIVHQLIPSNTKDKIHLDIYKKSLSLLAPQLLKDRRSYKNDSDDSSDIYSLRLNIFKRFAYFILQREKDEIDTFLKPFVDSFDSTEETASFIGELISAEDSLKNYEQFWHIWHNLYPKIKELCNNNPQSYHLKEIIINYLLAWRWWREDIEEWHSLKSENLSLYANVSKEIGHLPAVLYSITKILNSIGIHFKNEGIDWIYTIVSNNSDLNLGDLELDTLYYLEKFLRKFIFTDRQKIRENIRLKSKILSTLDFMIERGSVHGYLLRESIL